MWGFVSGRQFIDPLVGERKPFMLGITRWHVFKIAAAILCIAALTWLGVAYLIPAPPSQITIAASPRGEHYQVLGTRYQGILSGTGIKVDLRGTGGVKENLNRL